MYKYFNVIRKGKSDKLRYRFLIKWEKKHFGRVKFFIISSNFLHKNLMFFLKEPYFFGHC